MAISIDFSKKYAHLICRDLSPYTVEMADGDSDIPSVLSAIPEQHTKPFIHPENGFVNKYCKNYDKPITLKRTRKVNVTSKK